MSTYNVCFNRVMRKMFIWVPLLSRVMLTIEFLIYNIGDENILVIFKFR